MASLSINVGNTKNFFCRDTYWQLVNDAYQRPVFKSIKGASLRTCNRENCRGAHSEDEIHTLPSIHNFNIMDKSTLNLVKIYNDIILCFDENCTKVKVPEFKTRLNNYKTLNFVEILNLWYDITCYHRKTKRNLTTQNEPNEFYSEYDDIPEFFIDNEDVVWSLERVTKMCSKHQNLLKIIATDKATIWDICIGSSVNCKSGCHNREDMICHDDFLNGVCRCKSEEEILNEKQEISNDILKYTKLLDDDLKPKRRKHFEKNLKELYIRNKSLFRKVHLTDQGLIPFNIQMNNYREKINREEKIKLDEKEKEDNTKQERIDLLKKTKVKKIIRKPIINKV